MANSILDLYNKYFVERQFERLELFQLIADEFDVQRVLYAGSFVHVTPSFVFPFVVYVDNDKQANKFFMTPDLQEFIDERKIYAQDTSFRFHFADYRDGFDEKEESFDLLISQYAGFVGQYCKPFLMKGGLLLVNNSHGDAGVAAIDKDYQLVAGFSLRNGRYKVSKSNLDGYFIPKSSVQLTKEYLMKYHKGVGYTKPGIAYLFRRI